MEDQIDYVYAEGVNRNLLCPICLLPFQDPIKIVECGHHFCRKCFHSLEKNKNNKDLLRCPLDRLPAGSVAEADLILRTILSEILVQCPNEGCKETVQREWLKQHIQECRFSERKIEVCSNNGCNARLLPCEILSHKGTCEFRVVPCENNRFGCKEQLVARKMHNHLEELCQYQPIKCPQGCGCFYLRRNVPQHHCPCSQVRCKNAGVGCSFAGIRLDYMQHLEQGCSFAQKAFKCTPSFAKYEKLRESLQSSANSIIPLEEFVHFFEFEERSSLGFHDSVFCNNLVSTLQNHRDNVAWVQKVLAAIRISSRQDDHQHAFGHCDGIPAVLNAMRQHQHTHAIQEEGCRAVINLSMLGVNKKILRQKGAIPTLLHVLSVHNSVETVQTKAFGALWGLCHGDDANKLAVGEAGAIQLALQAARNTQNPLLLQHVFGLLKVLSVADSNEHLVNLHGGIEVIFDALRFHQSNASLVCEAYGILRNLTCHHEPGESQETLLEGIPVILSSMRFHQSDSKVQTNACSLLFCMAMHDTYSEELSHHDASALVRDAPNSQHKAALLHRLALRKSGQSCNSEPWREESVE